MPQLDPAYFTSQLFWLSIFFTIFYLCLSRMIIPKWKSLSDARSKLKDDNLKQAEKLANEIEKLKDDHIKAGKEVREKIQALKEETALKFEEYSKAESEKLNKKLENDLAKTEQAIAKLKSEGFDSDESSVMIIAQAQKIIDKISGLKIDKSGLKKLLEESNA